MVLYEELGRLLKIHKFKKIDFDFEDSATNLAVWKEKGLSGKYDKHLAYEFEHNVLKKNFRPWLGDEPSDQTELITEAFRTKDPIGDCKKSLQLSIDGRLKTQTFINGQQQSASKISEDSDQCQDLEQEIFDK
jgi:hypothetical protein